MNNIQCLGEALPEPPSSRNSSSYYVSLKRSCPKCTFDNDQSAYKCAMCGFTFYKVHASKFVKESLKLVRNRSDLDLLVALDRVLVDSSSRCTLRGGAQHMHLPHEIEIQVLPTIEFQQLEKFRGVSRYAQPTNLLLLCKHKKCTVKSHIMCCPHELLRLIPKSIKIKTARMECPKFKLLPSVARRGALTDPEVLAFGRKALKKIDEMLVQASKNCSIIGAGHVQGYEFPFKVHAPSKIVVELLEDNASNSSTDSTTTVLQRMLLKIVHSRKTTSFIVRLDFECFKKIWEDGFLEIHDENYYRSLSRARPSDVEKITKNSFIMKEDEEKDEEEDMEKRGVFYICCVCQDKMKPGERIANFGCPPGHKFHLDCLLPWLERQAFCPICRYDPKKASQ